MTSAVTLTPLTPSLVDALRRVQVADDQIVFSGQPSDVIDDRENADIDIHVICYGSSVAGMFRIDRGYYRQYPFADPDTPGLRTFLVDAGLQGRGIATGACRLLREYLRDQYKDANSIFLTVNLRNPIARKVYMSGGFLDTDRLWLKGAAGPQNILKLPLKP